MRFLANENFPGAAIAVIREAGHEVEWVRIAAPGMSDPDVLAWAARDERILLTFDKASANWPEHRHYQGAAASFCFECRCQGQGRYERPALDLLATGARLVGVAGFEPAPLLPKQVRCQAALHSAMARCMGIKPTSPVRRTGCLVRCITAH